MKQLFLLLLLWNSNLLAAPQWPEWLGEDLQPEHSSHWQAQTSAEGVTFVPAQSVPKVMFIVSRKSKSYDIALATLMGVFSRELPQAHLVVRLLPTGSDALARLLTDAEKQVHLIYTLGSKATVSVRRAYRGGKLPVVSVNAKDPVQLGLITDYQGSGDNFAFTSLNLPSDVTLAFLKRFNPELQQIGVLYAKANMSAYLTQYLPLKKVAQRSGLKIVPIVVQEDDPSHTLKVAMQKGITELQQEDVELKKTVLWLTGSSSLLARVDEINQYSRKLALISAVPDVVRQGQDSALMSFGASFVNNAHQAALYGLKVIRGETTPGDLPVGVISPPDIAINFEQAQRIDQAIPFVLMEMASEVYGTDGTTIRAQGKSVEESPSPSAKR